MTKNITGRIWAELWFPNCMSYIQNEIYKFLIPVNQLFTERKYVTKSSIKLILQNFFVTPCVYTPLINVESFMFRKEIKKQLFHMHMGQKNTFLCRWGSE